MKSGPFTGWRRGDRVVTTKDVKNLHRPDPLPAGTVLILDRCCRVQDDHEVWEGWQGTRLWCVTHRALEKASTIKL